MTITNLNADKMFSECSGTSSSAVKPGRFNDLPEERRLKLIHHMWFSVGGFDTNIHFIVCSLYCSLESRMNNDDHNECKHRSQIGGAIQSITLVT